MKGPILHATAVAISGNGVILTGASGSGKSDLALRLIDRGAKLVSDDAVGIADANGSPMLLAAPNIEGKIEIRGLGIQSIEFVPSVPLRLVVQLADNVDRMPLPDIDTDICGYRVPFVKLAAFEPSAAIKVEFVLRSVVDAGRWPVAGVMSAEPESSKT